MGKSLAEWMEDNDAAALWADLEVHAACAGPDDFARMAMISFRQWLENRGIMGGKP